MNRAFSVASPQLWNPYDEQSQVEGFPLSLNNCLQAEEASRERCEALQVAEAYRLALEQQMERGRSLAHQLVVMATKTDLVQSPTSGKFSLCLHLYFKSSKTRRLDLFIWRMIFISKLACIALARLDTRPTSCCVRCGRVKNILSVHPFPLTKKVHYWFASTNTYLLTRPHIRYATKNRFHFPFSADESGRSQRAKHTFKWVVNQLNTDDLKILVNAKKLEEEVEKRNDEERKKKEEEEKKEMIKAIRTEAALFLAEMVS